MGKVTRKGTLHRPGCTGHTRLLVDVAGNWRSQCAGASERAHRSPWGAQGTPICFWEKTAGMEDEAEGKRTTHPANLNISVFPAILSERM